MLCSLEGRILMLWHIFQNMRPKLICVLKSSDRTYVNTSKFVTDFYLQIQHFALSLKDYFFKNVSK